MLFEPGNGDFFDIKYLKYLYIVEELAILTARHIKCSCQVSYW